MLKKQAFNGCKSLETAVLSEGMKTIPEGCFYQSGIHESAENSDVFRFPDNVSSIGMYAFSMCRNLAAVTLPAGLKIIERGTFC